MKLLLKILHVILLLILPVYVSARIGMGDWSEQTPCGNEINNFTGMTLKLKSGKEIENLGKWYFYKGYIVIQFLDNRNFQQAKVINETTEKIDSFKSRKELYQFLEKNKLQPHIWTRWFEDNWVFFNDGFMLFAWVFWLPTIIVYLLLMKRAIVKDKFKLRKPLPIILIMVTLIFVCILIADFYPQSI